MTKEILDYDVRRRLDVHMENLANSTGDQAGDCSLCADVTCHFNITARDVLAALENDGPGGDNVSQFTCDDREEDIEIVHSLREL